MVNSVKRIISFRIGLFSTCNMIYIKNNFKKLNFYQFAVLAGKLGHLRKHIVAHP